MGPIAFVKEYWRFLLLVVFVTAALSALFVPGFAMGDDDVVLDEENQTVDENPTNLEYGLGLEGGARISAPPVGMTVSDLAIEHDEQNDVQSAVQQDLGLEPVDVTVRFHEEGNYFTIEVFDEDTTESEFAGALQAADVEVVEAGGEREVTGDDVENRVTQDTRDQMIETIELRINEAGLSGGTAYEEATLGGEHYIVTEVPGMTSDELHELLTDRGDVRVVAYHPGGENGTHTNDTVLTRNDMSQIGSASYDDRYGQHYVSVTVDDTSAEGERSPAEEYEAAMNEYGFTSQGVGQCTIQDRQADEFDFDHPEGDQQWCLLTMVDDDVVDAHPMGDDLAASMYNEEWSANPTFRMIVPTQQDAHSLAVNLHSGALSAPLDFDRDQQYSISPALADQFKEYSLLIGVLSILTVSGVVFLRYRDKRVALPMIATAMAEVVILLGFAAAIRMPLDLSHVAGFIAVVGTGVDDLVIIADEVMDEGDVNSQRVFESRFRKAFWIIGAAAATTIIAMSPLAVLSLGDLRGFAIITILGVLIGVLITRPAYGDILQRLLTDK
ncbi:preprotein translocase subunit SecD [Natronobacterium gregoryi]|uniref:Protein-export membrane protein SecD n=2 Tax=Natronobacterium gregoryi TaxID=44930 RepID=L0AGP7_NATGS|nr:preprotein translocase subunit SecD [Natronobacterium gregoryi]AFZ72250.1 preprotein translocase subunit SecD [Natronobacterium gregoryi SP2]ELY62350.1 preprotein translocase subunit SecD [Natronobacterium gregoryi SP2]PLK20197.1 preprotein translocase subunit SecD [Natronobacterium gregoryi SP2]SFJ28927.1 preprotein translocase subunit SecD [Natronobacterium gregoryi]